jgi:solute carrier family 25 phosphate transporter 23/24/25/41
VFAFIDSTVAGFCVYGAAKDELLLLRPNIFRDQQTGRINAVGSMLGGAISGFCTSAFIFPVDVVRKRLQVQGALTSVTPYSRYHGPPVIPQTVIDVDYSGKNSNNNFNFTKEFVEEGEGASKKALSALLKTQPAATPSVVECSTRQQELLSKTRPTELARSKKLQPGYNAANNFRPGSAYREAHRIYRNEGVRGFYRGIVPELLKVCPMIAITFCTYEFVLDKLSISKVEN